ncbi:hypothetical protein CVIRNUC_002986 [Coccomyxa viridis]|uniref:Hexosyltransferase n=1 Tax=Coccomyxa viridis TaxID=1274662 RepID=A0AAV1HYT4_9CHLO|nr:hypothetical protein CVIRNUC_002986 [Coccomyxa viridis]
MVKKECLPRGPWAEDADFGSTGSSSKSPVCCWSTDRFLTPWSVSARETSLVLRFVIGHSKVYSAESAIEAEVKLHGGFLRLPIQEDYDSLTSKTLSFLRTATKAWDAEYIVKVIPTLLVLSNALSQDYIGCMKNGPVFADRKYRWYERQWALLGDKYFTHAWGTLYVLSGRIAAQIASMPDGILRFFSNEGKLIDVLFCFNSCM